MLNKKEKYHTEAPMIKLSEFASEIPDMYDDNTSIHLIGKPGCGKSYTVENVWPKLIEQATGIKTICIIIHGTSIEAIDVRGFAVPVKMPMPDGTVKVITKYTPSALLEIIETTLAEAGATQYILLLDEFLQCDVLVQKAFSPVILSHEFGGIRMPDGGWVVMASNDSTHRAGAGKALMHNVNRGGTYICDDDVRGAQTYVQEHNLHPLFSSMIETLPKIAFGPLPDNDRPYPTMRSLTYAWRILSDLARQSDGSMSMHIPINENPEKTDIKALRIAGFIGNAAAAELFGYIKVADQLPEPRDVIANPLTAKVPSKADGKYAACSMIEFHIDAGNAKQFITYFKRFSSEYRAGFISNILNKLTVMGMNDPSVLEFIIENGELINRTN